MTDRFGHLAGNMNDCWQVAKTRKLNRQKAASGERQQCVYWSRSPPPKADSQIQNRLWGVPSTRIASGSGHSTLNFDRQVSTGPSLCKSQFRLRIKQFECCLDASTKKAGQVSLKAEAQRFNQLPRNALIRDKAFQIDQNYG